MARRGAEGGATLISSDPTRGNVLELDGVNGRVDLSDHVGSFSAQQSGTVNVYRIPAMVRAANGDLLAFAEARSGGGMPARSTSC